MKDLRIRLLQLGITGAGIGETQLIQALEMAIRLHGTEYYITKDIYPELIQSSGKRGSAERNIRAVKNKIWKNPTHRERLSKVCGFSVDWVRPPKNKIFLAALATYFLYEDEPVAL